MNSYNGLIRHNGHSVRLAENGPEDQLVYEQRFQVAFKETASLCRKVYFSHFIAWMGKIREIPMENIAANLVQDFTSGEWGMVTNSTSLRVFDDAASYDVIEARAWISSIQGSSFVTTIEFSKVDQHDKTKLLAIGEVKATWVRLVDYGVPSPRAFPEYVEKYLALFAPKKVSTSAVAQRETPLTRLDLGSDLYRKSQGLGIGRELWQETFQTTLEEANLVGNVYYANYFIWQGRTRDLFLHTLIPDLLRSSKVDSELVCLYTRMDYLREAMPFDRVTAVMGVESVSECGAVFIFEFYRQEADGSLRKLSVGRQETAWVTRTADDQVTATPWPDRIRKALVPVALHLDEPAQICKSSCASGISANQVSHASDRHSAVGLSQAHTSS